MTTTKELTKAARTRKALDLALVALNKGMDQITANAKMTEDKRAMAVYVEMLHARRRVDDALWEIDHPYGS